jgi:hypothetical protein
MILLDPPSFNPGPGIVELQEAMLVEALLLKSPIKLTLQQKYCRWALRVGNNLIPRLAYTPKSSSYGTQI